jgi:hypothetical protein
VNARLFSQTSILRSKHSKRQLREIPAMSNPGPIDPQPPAGAGPGGGGGDAGPSGGPGGSASGAATAGAAKRQRSMSKTSGYRGVTAATEDGSRVAWRARIRYGKVVVNLGRCACAAAYVVHLSRRHHCTLP